MEVLQKYGLSLKPEKCEFEKTSVEYLRVVVSHNSVKMDPAKVAGVLEWLTPCNKMEVQSFLGFINFYQRFIEGFHTSLSLCLIWLKLIPHLNGHLRRSQPLTPSGIELPWLQFWRFRITPGLIMLRQIAQILLQELSCLRKIQMMENGILLLSCQNPCLRWKGTTRSTIRKCWQLSEPWKNGGTSWKEPNISLRSGQTIKISSTSWQLRNWTGDKLGGRCYWPDSTSSCIIDPERLWVNWMR